MAVNKIGNRKMVWWKNRRIKKRLLFYVLVLALPVLQFCIFYIYKNAKSFIMAFQIYSQAEGAAGYDIAFAGGANFAVAWETIKNSLFMIGNSLRLFFFNTVLGLTLALIFSFYIYKKKPLSGFYKVLLFLPQIISSVVFGLLYKYIVTDVYTALTLKIAGKEVLGLLDNQSTALATVIFYNVWIGFGVQVLMFTGSMNGINDSIVESAKLDGASLVKEFIHITIPMIYPTLVSFIVIGLAGIFTNQMHLYTLMGTQATDLSTLGYFLYKQANGSGLSVQDLPNSSYLTFPQLSALGLILTFIMVPLILLIKKMLEKFGPRAD